VVTFHTVNFSRKIDAQPGTSDMSWLIHELTHVWQYERMGAIYMAKAIHAQDNAGYDYGGVEALEENAGEGMLAFNLEQQGDIIRDYYNIRNGLNPRWGSGTTADLPTYEIYVNQVRR